MHVDNRFEKRVAVADCLGNPFLFTVQKISSQSFIIFQFLTQFQQ